MPSFASRSYESERDLLAMYDLLMVSTGESNTDAQRLYESVGFRVVNRYLEYVRA